MINPKEKAKEILDKMRVHQVWRKKDYGNVKMYQRAKECALICVDEILKIEPIIKNLPLSETKIMMEAYPKFWNEVKNEIKNL